MNRREFLKSVAAVSASGLCMSIAAASEPGAKKYNVLFLMSDEHSPHAVGCFGNTIVKTPTLDSLARQGVAFTSAYCQDPICVPSRASFLTGRMPSEVGVFGNDGGLDNSVTTLADVFKKAGYAAVWLGKQHWGGAPRFDDWPDKSALTGEQRTRQAIDKSTKSRLPRDAFVADWPISAEGDTVTKEYALRFLDESRDKPFFLGVSFRKPHFPFIVQEQYYRLYKDNADVPTVTPKMIEELPLVSRRERENYEFATLTEEQIKKARAIYYGMVTYVDELVGDILKEIGERGLRDNTIILYTADHGEMAGEHGLWYKNSLYEASVRIPHIWSFPKEIPQGRVIGAPVMNMDIFPTLCDLCGLPKPSGLEGKSLVPLMKGLEDGKDRVALSENYRGGSPSRMIRTQQWKYCYFHNDREQLFDLLNDPAEAVNLVDRPEYRSLAAKLKSQALEGWRLEDYFKKKKNADAKAGEKAGGKAEGEAGAKQKTADPEGAED